MVAMAIQSRVSIRESVERKSWTSEDWREMGAFLAQSLAVVCGAALLYSLGPAVGMVLIVGCLAAWSLCRNWTVSAKAEGCCDEESEHAAPVDSPAHCANPVWLRSGRLGMCVDSAARSVQRQGA